MSKEENTKRIAEMLGLDPKGLDMGSGVEEARDRRDAAFAAVVRDHFANKATEEGELPELPHTTYNGYSDGSEPLWTKEQMHGYATQAIAANRASRQVANKAEVEPELRSEIEKLTRYKHCMSYNDSYFSEPVGLVKKVVFQLDRLLSTEKAKEVRSDLSALHDDLNRITWEGEDEGWNLAIAAVQKRIRELLGIPTASAEEPYSAKLAKRGAPVAEVRAAERVEAMHKGVVGVLAGVKAEALATPPATTGASTAPVTDLEFTAELDRLLSAWADAAECGLTSHEAIREKIVAHVKSSKPLGASTVLTDAQIMQAWASVDTGGNGPELVAFGRAVERLVVAAQAGQVAVPFDFHAHLARQAAWSEETFGPGPRTKGVCDHIRKELLEIEADPLDPREWIDVVILGLDGAWRCGGTPEQIIAGIVAKQTKNEGRTWPDWRTADPDKAIEHDRSKDGAQASTAGRRKEGGAA